MRNRQTFNKLVRDRIPAIIEANGEHAITRKLSDPEYLSALKDKLREECAEACQDNADIVEELSDILEVLRAIATCRGVPFEHVETIRVAKADQRGGFDDRIFLVETYQD